MSKFGSHVRQGQRNGYGQFCVAKPAVVLAVDEGGSLLEAKDKSGGYTVPIFRDTSVYLEAPPGFNDAPDMIALARQYYPLLKAKWQQNPSDYRTITNEQGGNDPAVMRRLVAYEREVMRLANADGFKVAILNLATGTPGSLDQWRQIYAPFIVEAWQGGNLYARHVYGTGDLVGDTGNVLPGDPARPFAELGYLRSLGATGGVVLTECGLDAGFGFAGIERFQRQLGGYEKLLRAYPEFVGLAAWTLGLWNPFGEDANWQDALPAMTQYLVANPTAKWEWPDTVPPIPVPPPSTYLHIRLTQPANIRRDPSIGSPAITPVAVKEGLELIKVEDVTGQSVGGNNAWIQAAAFLSRSYVTDSGNGKVRTNRPVNLRVVPTVYNNTAVVTIPVGVEFEHLGNVGDLYNNGLWAAVALYIWRPLAIDVEPGIRLGSPLKIPLTITSPFGSPRRYPFEPTKKQVHEGLDWHTGGAIPVLAMEAGVVDSIRPVDPGFGYGLRVRIKHDGRYTSWYGHLSEIQVTIGQTVTKGQQIALSGRSGGSVHHLHATLQDVPSGLDGYVVDNVCDFTLLMHPAVSLGTSPPVPEPGGTYDLLDYMRGDGRQYELQYTWGGGGTHPCQTQRNGNIFYNVKGGGEYEECYYDEKFVYRGIDTSESPERYYTQNTGNIYGAMWAKRRMAIGETVTKSPLVIHSWKANCQERLRGQPTDRLTLVRHYDSFRFDSGITLSDVLYLEWNQGEGYFYAKGYGLVGFTFSGGKSYISEIHQGRPDLERREIPCFRPGSRYYAP